MSREARHASNSKKKTPRGSSSISGKDAVKTKVEPTKPTELTKAAASAKVITSAKATASKAEINKSKTEPLKPIKSETPTVKPIQTKTRKTESAKTGKAAKSAVSAASATSASTASAFTTSAAPTQTATSVKAAASATHTTSKAKPIELDRESGKKKSKRKSRRIIAALVIALAILLAIAGYGIFELTETSRQAEQVRTDSEAHMIATPAESSFDLAENPIDFAAEQAKAPDTYAWIYIPDTNVNLPIMRHPTDDNFYLKHTSDGEESVIGAIYTQSVNSTDFSDPVTVIYGHNLPKFDVMFTQLHKFEDAAFFDANQEFYIYMPGRALTYKVVAAYEYDNRHIINSFDFSDQAVVQEYFDSVLSPESDVAHVREGVSLSAPDAEGVGAPGDKIVQLSTCTNPSDPAKRYIVTGVLVSDDPTL